MKRSCFFGFTLLVAVAGAGCSLTHDDGPVGTARANISVVPANVACVQIIAAAGRTVTFNADVTPGQSAQLTLDNLPVGNVTFTGFAFPTSCAMSAGATPDWASAPTIGTILAGQVTDIALTLEPVGGAAVGVTFDSDGGSDAGIVDMGPPSPDLAQPTPVCGNGIREGFEQCDDGNTTNLDGCDATCQFEQNQRFTTLQQLAAPDSTCTANVLGSALNPSALPLLNSSMNGAIANGTLNAGFQLVLGDLAGQNGQVLLGNLTGTPVAAPAGVNYSGANDLDWWYTTASTSINAGRVPLEQLNGSVASGALTASGTETLPLGLLNFAPLSATVTMHGTIGASNPPTVSSGGPPGHLAGEHLDPMLTSFASMHGELCVTLPASSLATTPIASEFTSGPTQCQNPIGSTMLDLIVDGCSTTGFGQAITAQPTPDQIPLLGALPGLPPYKFGTDATGHVSSCTDAVGVPMPLPICLNVLGYSSAYTFTADRVIFK